MQDQAVVPISAVVAAVMCCLESRHPRLTRRQVIFLQLLNAFPKHRKCLIARHLPCFSRIAWAAEAMITRSPTCTPRIAMVSTIYRIRYNSMYLDELTRIPLWDKYSAPANLGTGSALNHQYNKLCTLAGDGRVARC